MHLLDIVTILVCVVMLGNELALSLFINPAIWRLDDSAITAELARSLGKVMPFWYALGLVLLSAESWLRHRSPAGTLLLSAAILWALTILYTVAFLVPRNNRIAKAPGNWQQLHHQWDTLHRWRILVLLIATLCLLQALLQCTRI